MLCAFDVFVLCARLCMCLLCRDYMFVYLFVYVFYLLVLCFVVLLLCAPDIIEHEEVEKLEV